MHILCFDDILQTEAASVAALDWTGINGKQNLRAIPVGFQPAIKTIPVKMMVAM